MPDPKVIGKISSTLEEIRDILIGSKPSKLQNSIQAIAAANVAVAELMSELVEINKESNKVSLKETIVQKSKQNDLIKKTNKSLVGITDILSEISDSVKKIQKKNSFKLSGTDDKKVLENILKDAKIDGTKDNKILSMLNVVSKLKDIKIKDLISAKFKINQVTKIYDKLVNSFKKFKSNKEVKKVNEFALSSIEIIKRLSKVAIFSKPAQAGAKAIEIIFFGKSGKGGLIGVFAKMNNHTKDMKKAKKTANDLFIISGKLLLVTLMMTGVALLGIPAMAGVLMTAGMMAVFGLTLSLIGLLEKPISKGNSVMIGMMTAVILAGVGLFLLNKGTKDLEWEQLAKAGAAILGFGVIAALLGTPAVFGLVSLGCIALSLMGVALIAIGGGVALFGLLVTDDAIEKISTGIPKIFKAMTSIFGKEKGGKANFGDSILGIITGCLKLGGAIFASGALMIIGVSLGFTGLMLRSWANFPTKAIDNIEYAITRLDDCLGLGIKNNRHSESGIGGQIVGMFSDSFGLASSMLQFGKTFFGMGTVLITGIVLGIVKDSIDKWKNFDTKSLDNIEKAIAKFDDMFGLGLINKPKGFWGTIGSVLGDAFNVITGPLQIGSTLLNAGKQFTKLATLSVAVGVVDKLVEVMIKAGKNGSLMKNSLSDVFDAFDTMIDYFFNDDRLDTSIWDSLSGMGMSVVGGLLGGPIGFLGATLLASDERKTKLSILTTSVGIVDKMADAIIKMGKYSGDVSSGLSVTFEAFDKLIDYLFGSPDGNGANALSRIGDAMSRERGRSLFSTDFLTAFFGDGSSQINTQLEILTSSVSIVGTMADALTKMNELGPNMNASIDSVFYALEKIADYFFGEPDSDKAGALARVGNAMSRERGRSLLSGDFLTAFFGDGSSQINTQLEIIVSCVGIVSQVAEVIKTMSNTSEIDTSIDNLFSSLDKIFDYFMNVVDEDYLDDVEDVVDELPDVFDELKQAMDYLEGMDDSIDTVKKFADLALPSISTILNKFGSWDEDYLDDVEDVADELPGIFDELADALDYFEGMDDSIDTVKKFADVALPSISTILNKVGSWDEDYLDDVEDVADELPGIFDELADALDYINGDYSEAINNLRELCGVMSSFSMGSVRDLWYLGSVFDDISWSLRRYSNYTSMEKIEKLDGIMKKFNDFANNGNPFAFEPITKVIDKINTIDMEKAQALTDTFKSFTNINTFGGFFFNFKKQVGLFTDACVRLIDAINGNTDALTTENILDEAGNAEVEPSKKSVAIANVQELAAQIADAISNNSFGGGFGDAIPVELRINGDGGDSWVIRKY